MFRFNTGGSESDIGKIRRRFDEMAAQTSNEPGNQEKHIQEPLTLCASRLLFALCCFFSRDWVDQSWTQQLATQFHVQASLLFLLYELKLSLLECKIILHRAK